MNLIRLHHFYLGFSWAILFLPAASVAFLPKTTPSPSTTFDASSMACRKMASVPTENASHPTPELTGQDVVTICMDALQMKTSNEALAICFDFSSDRCRAAVGGTLEEFMRYADNPIFGTLVNCDAYEIVSVGPIIPASSFGLGSRRGEMQTFLVEISEGMSMKTVMKGAKEGARRRPTVAERLRQRELDDRKEEYVPILEEELEEGKRRFIWTVQKNLRPPRQDCWLVHEVLFTKNACYQTE